jgi:Mrp family chromosome partitioning ATPase
VNEQAALLGLRSRLSSAQSTAEAARVRLDGLNHRERELKALDQEIALGEATRARYLNGVEQARIDRALEDQKISNIGVVQAATRPMLPIGPGRKWVVLIGVIVAAFAAMGTVFLFDYFDDSFHTPESVEAGLRIPVLASFPSSRRLARMLDYARDKKHPWNGSLPHGVARECRLMVARISAKLGAERRPLVLGVTSSKGGVGVTSVAAFLAAELASRGDGPVLLVDRDFSEQRLTRMLVDESAEAANLPVRATPLPQLHILPADDEDGELRELTTLRSFSFVVVDVPAVEASEHALANARSCDGVVFVVAPGKSHLLEAHRGIDLLKDGGVRVLGTVLNKRRSSAPD